MTGTDVEVAQKRLAGFGVLPPTAADGVYGPVTANATRRAQYVLGYANPNSNYDAALVAYMLGKAKPTVAMRARAVARKRKPTPSPMMGERAADRMVGWYVGRWAERPAKSNIVPQLSLLGKDLKLAAYYYQMGYAWCAYATFTAFLCEGSTAAKYGLREGKFNALYTPEIRAVAERGAYGLATQSKTTISKGTALLFDFGGSNGSEVDHIGIALGKPGQVVKAGGKTWRPGKNSVVTVEGNTSYDDGGSQSNGGCVAIRTRSLTVIRAAIRVQ
ncbi:MAG: peptidoglycan-binding protein [Thermoleophilia bacterium]|nr:peptidoglycan-binding protein [Thermoleophilia bacterium]